MAFGSSDNDVKIVVTLDAKGAFISAESLDKELEKLGTSAAKVDTTTRNLSSSLTSLGKGALGAYATFKSLQLALGGVGIGLLKTASEIENVQRQFEKLNIEAGNNPIEQLNKLQEATYGLLDNKQIFEQFNKAATLGLPVERFDELSKAAVKLGQSLGVDAANAIESFVTGAGRQSVLMLDNLGIIVSAEKAYQKYADTLRIASDKLTDAQRKTAFINEAIDQLRTKSDAAADVALTAAQAYQVVGNSLQNLIYELASGVSENENLRDAFLQMNEVIKNIDVKALASQIGDLAAQLVTLTTNAIEAASSLSNFFNSTLGFANFKQNAQLGLTAFFGTADDVVKKFYQDVRAGYSESYDAYKKNIDQLRSAQGEYEKIVKVQTKSTQATKAGTDQFKQFADLMHKTLAKASPEFEALKKKASDLTKEAMSSGVAISEIEKQLVELGKGGGIYDAVVEGYREANKELEDQKQLHSDIDEILRDITGEQTDIEKQAQAITDQIDLTKITYEEISKIIKDQNLSLEDQKVLAEEILKIKEQDAQTSEKGFANYTNGISDLLSQLGGAKGASDWAKILGDAFTGSGGAGSFINSISGKEGGVGEWMGLGATAGGWIALIIQGIAGGIEGLQNKKPIIDRHPELYQDMAKEIQIAFDEGIGNAFGGLLNERSFYNQFEKILQKLDVMANITGYDKINNAFIKSFSLLSLAQKAFGIFGSNDPGERARKAFTKELNKILEEHVKNFKLVIDGQATPFSFQKPSGKDFSTPTSVFNQESGQWIDTQKGFEELMSLGDTARNIFLDVGKVLGTSMFEGIEEFAGSGVMGQFAAILADSVGGSLNNLQLAFQSMGLSAEEMQAAIDQAYFTGELSAKEFLSTSAAVQELYAQGIPGAIGAVDQAFQNLQEGGLTSGQIAQDALGDIGAELLEIAKANGGVGGSFDDLKRKLLEAGYSVDQVNILLQALQDHGINTAEALANIDLPNTAAIVSELEDLGFAFDEPLKNLEEMNSKLNELENRKIAAYVDVNFRAVGDQAAIDAVQNGGGVNFGQEGRA